MENKKSCCSNGTKYVLSCSGACDLGNIADLVARKLSESGIRKMHCLAIVAAGVEKPTEELKNSALLLIDGCPVDCARKIVDAANFKSYTHFRITDMGFVKGQTSVSESNITEVYQTAAILN